MTTMNDAVLRALEAQMNVRQAATTVHTSPEPLLRRSDEVPASGSDTEARAAPLPVEPATIVANACGVCARPVTSADDRVVRGRCSHVYHTTCMVPLIQAGRQFCMQCPLARSNDDARSHGGYSIDSGNDADVRESIAAALEYRRNQVRDELIERASAGALRHRLASAP